MRKNCGQCARPALFRDGGATGRIQTALPVASDPFAFDVAGRFATLSPGRRCRRTPSLSAFSDFRETPSREMAEDAAPPMPDNPDDDDHARSKNIQDFCEEISDILFGPERPSSAEMTSRRT